jgi:hypothetical protein
MNSLYFKRIVYLITVTITALLILSSCKSKTAAPPEGVVEVVGIGSVNFGRVALGEYRIAAVKVTNNTKTIQSVTYPSPVSPFSVYIPSSTCTSSLASGSSCLIAISFSPLARLSYNTDITVSGKSVSFQGQGVITGALSAVPNSWNINNTAGQSVTQTFTIYNGGDSSIPFPSIINMNNVSISRSMCDVALSPGSSCDIDITFLKTTSGSQSNLLTLFSNADISTNIAVTSNISPSTAEGVITFQNAPVSMTANGTDIATINAIVLDSFSNIVADGTVVSLTGSNINFPDGASSTVIGGRISFRVQTTITKTATSVSASVANAFGQLIIPMASGTAVGVITTQNFNNTLLANGLSSVTVTTNPLHDIDGNVVDDGQRVYFSLTGAGSLKQSSAFIYNGRVSVDVVAPVSVGTANLIISSAPIYSGQVITGYGAQSAPIPFSYTAGFPSGTFAVSCSNASIYYNTSVDAFLSTVDRTLCTAGPFSDVNANLVGAGYPASISILNGYRCSDSSVGFSTVTDTASTVTFTLCGNNSRGAIQVTATAGGTSVTHSIFAASSFVKKYEPYNNNYSLYRGYGPSIFSASNVSIKPPSETGSRVQLYSGDLGALVNNDTDHLGSVTYSAPAKTLTYNFPRLLGTDCLQNVGPMVQILPCFYFLYSNSRAVYDWGNSGVYNIGYDGALGILNNTAINTQLGSATGHGSYHNIFSNQFYNPSSDTYITMGGLEYSATSPYSTSVNSILSQIIYPLSFKTSFDVMTYRQDASGLPYMMSIYSTPSGKTYLFGGVNIDGTLSNGVYSITRDITQPLGVSLTSINMIADPIYGSPVGLVSAGLYMDETTNFAYVIGGRKRVGGVWTNNDQIWKFDTSLNAPVWSRVSNNSGLPITSVTNWASTALFPLTVSVSTPTTFDNLTTYANHFKIRKDTNGDLILFVESGSLYNINLTNGTTALITDTNGMAYFNGSSMFTINPLTGRKFSFTRGSKTAMDSSVKFFETPRGNKAYFMSKFTLDTNSHFSALRLNIKVSGFAWAKDAGGVEDYGLNSYIYNFATGLWENLGTTISATNAYLSYGATQSYTINTNTTNYVDINESVYILHTSKGAPGCYMDISCINDGESNVQLNYIELSGEF